MCGQSIGYCCIKELARNPLPKADVPPTLPGHVNGRRLITDGFPHKEENIARRYTYTGEILGF